MLLERPKTASAKDRRPKGVIAIGWASFEAAAMGRSEHAPTSKDYPDSVMRRITFASGGGLNWTLSALETPRETPAPWKIVVITGAPSWAEYWAPVLAALPQDRQMIVVDRPGFAGSQPATCVPDIRIQAEALSPLLDAAPGQKVLLVGQSYGAAIATLMAERHPRKVHGLVLLSSFLGVFGPTARWLVDLGERLGTLIPRDLRHAIIEVVGQPSQLPHMHRALSRVKAPIHVVHGDRDDFAPADAAEMLVAEAMRPNMRFMLAPGADHFMNDGPPQVLLDLLEACVPAQKQRFWDRVLPKLAWPRRQIAATEAVAS